ncbi:hypothetical protein BC937DRAFT_90767, partial [Endogone sp. FLAS-F59071]
KILHRFPTESRDWSLADFDLWASTNIANSQVKAAHLAFYRHLNDILLLDTTTEDEVKNARRLINSKKVRPLWKNSAVLAVVKRASEIVRSDLDKATEDRVRGLVFGRKNQRDDDNSEDVDDDNPFLVHDNGETEDGLDEEESGTLDESVPSATPKKRNLNQGHHSHQIKERLDISKSNCEHLDIQSSSISYLRLQIHNAIPARNIRTPTS